MKNEKMLITSDSEKAGLAIVKGTPIVVYFPRDCCPNNAVYEFANLASNGTELVFSSECGLPEPRPYIRSIITEDGYVKDDFYFEGITGSPEEGYTLKNGVFVPTVFAGVDYFNRNVDRHCEYSKHDKVKKISACESVSNLYKLVESTLNDFQGVEKSNQKLLSILEKHL